MSPDIHAEPGDLVHFAVGEDFPEIRQAIRKICAGYPGAYWRDLEAKEAYPTDFVQALTREGYLSALIPEEPRRRAGRSSSRPGSSPSPRARRRGSARGSGTSSPGAEGQARRSAAARPRFRLTN
mgnify:CR=1 FL=1